MKRVSLAFAVVLLLGACSDDRRPPASAGSLDPFATESGASSRSARPATPVSALVVGACFDSDAFVPGATIDAGGVHAADCSAPHQQQVYAVAAPFDAAGPFPGDVALDDAVTEQCLTAFAVAIGADYEQSTLDFAAIRPTRDSWARGDRTIVCAVHDADFALLTGSVLASPTAVSRGG